MNRYLSSTNKRSPDAFRLLVPTAVTFVTFAGAAGLGWLVFSELKGLLLGFLSLFAMAWVGQRVFLRYSNGPEEQQFLRHYYWRAFIILVVVTCLFYGLLLVVQWKGRPGFYYDDESVYDRRGWDIATSWRLGVSPPYEATHTKNFVWIVAAIYYLFDHFPVLVRLLNVLSGLWLAVSVAGIARVVFPRQPRIGENTFWLIVLNPIILVWSTSHIRDIQVAAGSAIVLWSLVQLIRQRKLGAVLVGGAALTWVWYLRPLAAGLLVTAILLGLLFRELSLRLSRRAGQTERGSTVLVILVMLSIASTYGTWEPVFTEVWEASGGFIGTIDYESFSTQFYFSDQELVDIPVSLVRLFFIPNPFWAISVRNFNTVVQSMAGVAWYILLPFWIAGWMAVVKRGTWELWPVHIFTLGMMLAAAYSLFTEYSDPMRIRVPALPFLMLFAAYGIHLFREAGSRPLIRGFVAMVYAFEWFFLGIFYLFTKAFPWSVFSLQGALGYTIVFGAPIALAFTVERLRHRERPDGRTNFK